MTLKTALATARHLAYDAKRKAGFPLNRKQADALRRNYFGIVVTAMQVTAPPLFLLFATTEFCIKLVENILVEE